MFDIININERLVEIHKELAKREENFLIQQLNKLVEDGILVIVVGPLTLIRRDDGNKIEMHRMIGLDVRDREIIDGLKARVAELEATVEMYKAAF